MGPGSACAKQLAGLPTRPVLVPTSQECASGPPLRCTPSAASSESNRVQQGHDRMLSRSQQAGRALTEQSDSRSRRALVRHFAMGSSDAPGATNSSLR